MFLLMGEFHMSRITSDAYETAYVGVGHLPGGLAIATIIACTLFLFAACTGSSIAGSAVMTHVDLAGN